MAKSQGKKGNAAPKQPVVPAQTTAKVAPQQASEATAEPLPKRKLSILDFSVQAIIVSALAIICYINSVPNEYAHDDGIVIVKNEYVLEGFAGLKGIFTKDAYDSYYKQLNTINQLAGGRYRPLSIATFAVEQQLFGPIPEDKVDSFLKTAIAYGIRGPAEKKIVQEMHIRHFFNILWYVGCVVALLYFLHTYVFKSSPLTALIATALFTVHPVHTEVVANVKSRDEIMSLLFICLTFIFAFKYDATKKLPLLLAALGSYFLAFLSKEYAITLLALLPLSFYLLKDYSIGKSVKLTLPYLAVVVLYVYVRVMIAIGSSPNIEDTTPTLPNIMAALSNKAENADKEVLNNPYVFATDAERSATVVATSINYLKLLFVPTPLSADYSYNTIPYKNFGHPLFWLSLIVHLALVAATVYFAIHKKKFGIYAFALAIYLSYLLLVNNFIFNIGATMGERLIFHSSVGFCMVVAMLLVAGARKLATMEKSPTIALGLTALIVVLYSAKTIARNPYWKNDKTLFMEDIKVVPNSVLVNGNVAASYITMADQAKDDATKDRYIRKAISLLNNALAVHPKFVAGYLNKGIGYFKLGELDSAKACLDSVRRIYPNYPTLKGLYTLLSDYYMKNGWNKYGKFGNYAGAVNEFKQGIAIDSTNPELWYNLGGAYFSNKQYPEAVQAWNRALQIKPDHVEAARGMQAAMGQMNRVKAEQQRNGKPGQ